VFLDPLRWRAHPELANSEVCAPQDIRDSVPSGFRDRRIFVPFLFLHIVSNFIQTPAATERTVEWVPGPRLAYADSTSIRPYAEDANRLGRNRQMGGTGTPACAYASSTTRAAA
jgi:hypothetical protein